MGFLPTSLQNPGCMFTDFLQPGVNRLYHVVSLYCITISGWRSSVCILIGSLLLDAGDPCFQSGHLDGAGHFSNRHLRLDKT